MIRQYTGSANHRERDECAEKHIRRRRARKTNCCNARRKNERCQQRRPIQKSSSAAVVLPSEPADRSRGSKRRKCGRQARSPLRRQIQPKSDCRRPIVENRFFKPWLPVEPRRNPITSLRHCSRDPRIAGFIRPNQPEGAESAKQANEDSYAREDRIPKTVSPQLGKCIQSALSLTLPANLDVASFAIIIHKAKISPCRWHLLRRL